MDCVKSFYLVRPDLKQEDLKDYVDMRTGLPYPITIDELKHWNQKQRRLRPDLFLEVGCGQCLACRKQRTREWSLRLLHESSCWNDGVFLTLTYDDEHVPLYMTKDYGLQTNLVKSDLQKYFKRLRKRVDKPLRHFSCGEYGSQTFRCHYHSIVFGLGLQDAEDIKACWQNGFVDVEPIGLYQICYVAGYIQKKLNNTLADEVYQGRLPPFQVHSLGLGLDYLVSHEEEFVTKGYCGTVQGSRNTFPRYYLKKSTLLQSLKSGMSEEQLYKKLSEISDMTVEEFEESLEKDKIARLIKYQESSKKLSMRNSKI